MQTAKMFVVLFAGVVSRVGFTVDGLGLVKMMDGLPEFGLSQQWGLFHLGSGHLIITVSEPEDQAKAIAKEVASWGDWTFESLSGWRNHIPDLWDRISHLQAKHPTVHPTTGNEDEALARKVMEARYKARSW